MAEAVRLYYRPEADTLDLWLGEPREDEAEPLTDNVVVKLRRGRPVGLEVLQVSRLSPEDLDALPPRLREALADALDRLAAARSALRRRQRP